MPRYREDNPEHPRNRALLLWLAVRRALADLAVDPDTTIPTRAWRRLVMNTSGVTSRQAAHDLTEAMEDWGMIDVEKREGVRLTDGALDLFPHLAKDVGLPPTGA